MNNLKILISTLSIFVMSSSFGAVAKLDKLWPTSNIKVCFASKDHKLTTIEYNDLGHLSSLSPKVFGKWDEHLKTKVKSWINNEYKKEITGVFFSGFEDCSSELKNEVVAIYISSDSITNVPANMKHHGMASIANNGHLDFSINKKAYAYFLHPKLVKLDMGTSYSVEEIELIFKQNVIHEFGHLAGLLHEHDREEIGNDHSCKKIVGEETFMNFVQSTIYNPLISLNEYSTYKKDDYIPAVKMTSYDESSVMNYCMIKKFRNNPKHVHSGLSLKDRNALKFMYKNK